MNEKHRIRLSSTLSVGVLVLILGSAGFDSRKGQLLEKSADLGFSKILMVERHAIHSSHVYTYHAEDNKPGGGLHVLDLVTGQVREILSSDKGLILDAALHYDGKTILFSWKKDMRDYFQLYTIDTAGNDLRQITNHPSNNFNACWLPDGGIAFLSDRKPAYAYCWSTTTPILFRCDGDGTGQTRLSANYLNDFTPSVMQDGRILYSRWEYVDRPAIPIQSLWSINPDGTRLQGIFGNRVLSPATFMDAREIPGSNGKILCVLTAHNRHCHGAIGIVDPRVGANAQSAIRNITPEIDIGQVNKGNGNHVRGPYVNPYPLDPDVYLVSREGNIEFRAYDNSVIETVLAASEGANGLGFYSPQPVMERKREPVISSTLTEKQSNSGPEEAWAEVHMIDVYNGLPVSVERGSIDRLAVVQELEKPLGIDPGLRAFGFQFPVVSAGATYAPKKVWGFAKIEADGSARFKVPARQPIYFLPIDKEGMAVQRMRTFTHLMPGEKQGCVGCHADRNYAVGLSSGMSLAMRREAEDLVEPGWGPDGFSYSGQVQPILDRHCVDCHGRDDPAGGLELTADKTDFFNVSYENLVRKGTPAEDYMAGGHTAPFDSRYTSWIPTFNGQEINILQIEPGAWGARASLLGEILKSGHVDSAGVDRIALTEEEKLTMYMWMDLNVPYYGGSNSNYRSNRGCRQQIPPGFIETFEDVASRKCVACHVQKDNLSVFSYPRQFALRLDNPELNPVLKAPLNKQAGGSGKCGATVFSGTGDADYVALLETFDVLERQLVKRPRLDMFEGGHRADGAAQIPGNRNYLIADHGSGNVCIYSDMFGVVWSYPVEGIYDCWMRPNGNVIASGYHFVMEIEPNLTLGHGGNIVWKYDMNSAADRVATASLWRSCQLLDNGNVLVSEPEAGRLVELDPGGAPVRTFPLPGKGAACGTHMVRSDHRGNFFVACAEDAKVKVVDGGGRMVGEILLGQHLESNEAVFEATPLRIGNVLVSIADACRVLELDRTGKIVWDIGKEDLPGIHMTRIAGVQRLSNGNTMMCGAGGEKSPVHALEVTEDRKIVWQLTNLAFKDIARIQVIPPESCGGLTGSIY